MRLQSTPELHGETATRGHVPDAVVTALGSSRRPAVTGTVDGHTCRSSLANIGGVFLLGTSPENRTAQQVSAGDVLDVGLDLDTAGREVTVPEDLAAALEDEPGAWAAFEALSSSGRRAAVERC